MLTAPREEFAALCRELWAAASVSLGPGQDHTAMALLSVFQRRPDWLASAHRAALLTWPLVSLAMAGLIYLIATNHFELDYVASVSNRAMPLYLKVTAVWGGQAGSLLFWGWLMASFSGAAMLRKWERDQALMPYVVFVTMVTLAFFLGLVVLMPC